MNNRQNSTNINWYPGHMAKTKKQIIEDLKLIDIIIEILDARAPRSSQNPDVKEYSKNKKKIVVLNKADLADDNITSEWIEYYKKNNINCVRVEANSGKGLKEVINQIKIAYKEVEEKYIQKGRIGRSARVMILGIPNVGKSTFINSLAKRSVAKVGNRPGVTKNKQWIKVENQIELLDTPGMLWPKLDDDCVAEHLAYLNTIGENAIDNEEIIDIRDKIAIKKGAILSGGRINYQKISDMILNDFRDGKLGKITIEKP